MRTLASKDLQPGMTAAKPIITKRGQIIAPQGTKLTEQLITRLAFYKIEEVTVEDEESPAQPKPENNQDSVVSTKHSYSQKLRMSPQFQSFQTSYTANREYLKEIFAAISAGEDSQASDILLEQADELVHSKTPLELFDMLHNMRSIDDSVYAHSLNVALIARSIGKWLHFSKEDLQVLTLAGLLHDIGKTQIPEEILNKPGKYTDEEFQLVRSHPLTGHKMLKGKGFDSRILLATLQHHERQDGSGYPRGLQADEIDDFASIIAIADVYDAMTAARSYRTPLCSFQVIAAFEEDGLQKYKTQYILTFLERVAAVYQNSRVILSDGRGAHVVYLNKHTLSRPMLKLDDETILDLSAPENKELYIQSIV